MKVYQIAFRAAKWNGEDLTDELDTNFCVYSDFENACKAFEETITSLRKNLRPTNYGEERDNEGNMINAELGNGEGFSVSYIYGEVRIVDVVLPTEKYEVVVHLTKTIEVDAHNEREAQRKAIATLSDDEQMNVAGVYVNWKLS